MFRAPKPFKRIVKTKMDVRVPFNTVAVIGGSYQVYMPITESEVLLGVSV